MFVRTADRSYVIALFNVCIKNSPISATCIFTRGYMSAATSELLDEEERFKDELVCPTHNFSDGKAISHHRQIVNCSTVYVASVRLATMFLSTKRALVSFAENSLQSPSHYHRHRHRYVRNTARKKLGNKKLRHKQIERLNVLNTNSNS